MNETIERFDHTAEHYESWYETPRGIRVADAERRLLGSFLGPNTTTHRVLEVGCGTGYFTEWLGTRYQSAVGLDPARAMLLELRRRRRAFPVVRADAAHLPFASGSFAAVFFITTLEFLDDPEEALREAVRVARGEVVLLWLNPWSFGALERWIAPGFLLSRARRLSLPRVRKMLLRSAADRAHGFEWGGALFPWPFRRVQARIPFGDVVAIKLSLVPPAARGERPAESGR